MDLKEVLDISHAVNYNDVSIIHKLGGNGDETPETTHDDFQYCDIVVARTDYEKYFNTSFINYLFYPSSYGFRELIFMMVNKDGDRKLTKSLFREKRGAYRYD
jgi:hypothetical protein